MKYSRGRGNIREKSLRNEVPALVVILNPTGKKAGVRVSHESDEFSARALNEAEQSEREFLKAVFGGKWRNERTRDAKAGARS